MEVTWQVEDGYAGAARPQHTDIPDEELEACETEQEREDLINGYIQDDFDQNISWYRTDDKET